MTLLGYDVRMGASRRDVLKKYERLPKVFESAAVRVGRILRPRRTAREVWHATFSYSDAITKFNVESARSAF